MVNALPAMMMLIVNILFPCDHPYDFKRMIQPFFERKRNASKGKPHLLLGGVKHEKHAQTHRLY